MRTTYFGPYLIFLACLIFACGDEGTSASLPNTTGEGGSGGSAAQGGNGGSTAQGGAAGQTSVGGQAGQGSTMVMGGQVGQGGNAGEGGQGGSGGQGAAMGQGGTSAAPGQQCGIVVRPVAAQSGVVYTASFSQPRLQWYRTDGEVPYYENQMELSSGTIDMVLDSDNELLFVLHDVTREAVWYRLNRPTSPAEPLFNRPQEAARISFTHRPVAFTNDRIRNRLFTLTQPPVPDDGGAVREMVLEITDLTNGLAPIALPTMTVPSATALIVDAQRGLLFLYTNLTEKLLAYDVSGQTPRLLPEMTVDLETTFPEPSQTAFNLKGFRLDEQNGHLYASRDQVPNSQAVIFEYSPATTADANGCVTVQPYATIRTDPLDQDVAAVDRTNLMGAAVVEPVLGKGGAFFAFAAWNGTMAQPMVTMLDEQLNFMPTCGDFATDTDLDYDFGCFVSGNAFEDRGVCVDSTHQIGVVTVSAGVQFFPINQDLSFGQPTEINEGGAIVAVCH